MKPIDLALCITDLDVGGAERCMVRLATGLDRGRFSPVVYCLARRPKNDSLEWMGQMEKLGVPVHFLNARGKLDFFRAIGRLRKLLAAQSPQVFQSFLFHANIVGRIAARRAGVPVVLSGIRVAEREQKWHLWFDRKTSNKVDCYVCVSGAVARFSFRNRIIGATKFVVIPNGIDCGAYPDKSANLEELGVPGGCEVVTFVGRLVPQKGLVWLLDSAANWLARLPDVHLLLVGKGPEREKLERIAEKRGISERVHFAGWREDVPGILAASDLLVLPSRWEGMPNVVLEAMATGLTVVSTSAEGVSELLGPKAETQTVEFGDSQAIADKIVTFMKDKESRDLQGQENRARARDVFGVERMVSAYQDLWESLVGKLKKS